MANRMIRDWTTSEKIDQLTELGELFFVRLIMKADDHGCFHANPKLLKAALFPLKDYSETQMSLCIKELDTNSVIQVYESDGRKYLKINDFGQRLRTMVSKFPQPADICQQPADNARPELEEKRSRREVEEKVIHALASEINTLLKRTNPNTSDVFFMVKQWIDAGHQNLIPQLKAMKTHYEMNRLVFPTKIETLTMSFMEADWIEKLKESDPDRKAERITKTLQDANRRQPEPDTIGTSAPGSLS